MRIFDVRQLVSAGIGERFHTQEAILGHLVVQLRARHGVRERNLDGFAIQFLRKLNGLVDGFLGFARQTDDEVAVNLDPDLLAVLHELARHLHGRALLDVLQDLRIARFESHDKEPRPAIRHGLQLFVLAVAARRAGPLKFQWLEFLAQLDGPVAANVERIVVEENFLHLREVFQVFFTSCTTLSTDRVRQAWPEIVCGHMQNVHIAGQPRVV